MHGIVKPDLLNAHRRDHERLTAYLRQVLEGDREVYKKAIAFAVEERHEEWGNEKLACQLLAAALSRGSGFAEAGEVLDRLEARQGENSALTSRDESCYDCYDDPELQTNIALLRKALLASDSL